MSILIKYKETGGYIYQVVSGGISFTANCLEKEYTRKFSFYSNK